MNTDIHDLRFAFKMGSMAFVNAMQNDEVMPDPNDPQAVQDWLETKFQEFHQMYSQIQRAMGR